MQQQPPYPGQQTPQQGYQPPPAQPGPYQQGQPPPQQWGGYPIRPKAPKGPWTTRSRICAVLMLAGALLAVAAAFLPWGDVSTDLGGDIGEFSLGGGFNGFEGTDGWLAVGTAVLILVFAGLSFMPMPPRRGIIPIAIVTGLFLTFIGVANMGNAGSDFSGLGSVEVSIGIGLWLMVVAGVLVLAGAGFMIASQVVAPPKVDIPWQPAPGQAPYAPPPQTAPPGGRPQGYGQPGPGEYQQPQQGYPPPEQQDYPPPRQPAPQEEQQAPGQQSPRQPPPG